MRQGTRLRLKVSEWPDLTGEYTLSAEDTVSLPVIGAVDAGHLTAAELSKAIAARLQQQAGLPVTTGRFG